MLWKTPQEYLKGHCPETWAKIESMGSLRDLKALDQVDAWDDILLAAGRPGLLTKLLCKDRRGGGQDISDTRMYLRFFESLAMLRRGPGSFIFSDWNKTHAVSLQGLLPAVENLTVNIEPEPKLAEEYQTIHINLLINYLKTLNAWKWTPKKTKAAQNIRTKEVLKGIASTYREWQIASSSIDVYKLGRLLEANHFGTKAPDIAMMRHAGVTFFAPGKVPPPTR
jgi:hypothetical protein